MTKRILAGLLCLCMVLGMLAGCGKKKADPTEPSVTAPTESTPSGDDTPGGDVVTPTEGDDDTDEDNEQKEDQDIPAVNTGNTGSTGGNRPGGAPSYQVTFYTNGGDAIYPRYVTKGTAISKLPTPFRAGYAFAGWFYDKDLTKPVGKDDTVSGKLALYADYTEQKLNTELVGESFTSSLKVPVDFSITVVSSDPSMTAQQVLSLIRAKNLSDPDARDLLTVTGKDGVYTVTGKDGFAPGSTFRISLEDGRLSYDGKEPTVREYNFTTDMPKVMNLQMVDGMLYIPIEQLSDITSDGQQVSTLSLPLYRVDDSGTLTPTDMVNGQFTYHGSQELKVGDNVVVYAGLRPDLRDENTADEKNGEVAYVEITAVNGNVYSYTSSKAEDVIMRPDLLPVNLENDRDTSDNTLTLDNEYLDYSDDIYANIRLDANTTVDVGDFVMLHTGPFNLSSDALLGYGRVTVVTVAEDVTVITYEPCDWETVRTAMDIRTEQNVGGSQLLKDTDVEALEASIEQQALESGFANEAATYLVSAVTATDCFQKLPEGMSLSDIKVTLEDGTQVSPEQLQLMAGGVTAKVKLSKLAANISTDLKHFDGYSGIRLTLEIGAKITFEKGDNQVVLTVTGIFEQETRLSLDVTAQAIWNAWGIFPYIEEFRMVAAVDVFEYSGVAFDLSVGTKEKETSGEWTEDEEVDEFIKSVKEAMRLQKMFTPGDVDLTDTLVEKYTKMLESETDWINLVDKEIFQTQLNVPFGLPILILEMKGSFVVSLDASAALGVDFYYMCADRYVFTLDVFSGRISNDVVKIQEETYELTAYAMGRLGLRVGLRLEFNVGLVDTEMASVGFFAEGGAYAKLFGYLYYELKYAESAGKTQNFSGAMYIEVGGYLEIGLEAQAFKELHAYEISIYENEWPLLTVGQRENVLDFHTDQEKMPQVVLKDQKTAQLGDNLFMMEYLDLREGGLEKAQYDDSKDFTITFTNPAFTYLPETNHIVVTPGEGVRTLDGEMTITWNDAPMAFSSKPIQRTISIHWDNLRDSGYVIAPYTNGGSYVPTYCQQYNTPVKAPADPVKTGYVFAGWYEDEALTVPYTFPAVMPDRDVAIYAAWEPATDTPFRVEHYQQILGSSLYELVQTQHFTGTTEQIVQPQPLQYTGFVTPAKQKLEILPDGSAVMRYFYDRVVSTVTFSGGTASAESKSFLLQYGATVSAPQPAAPGYDFIGWDKPVSPVMGDSSVVYTAQWKRSSVDYRVEYYVQQPNGRYTLQEQVAGRDVIGTELSQQELLERLILSSGKNALETYRIPGGVEFEAITESGINLTASGKNATVEENAVIKVRFGRKTHTATFLPANGGEEIHISLYSGAALTAPTGLTRTGYAFSGWDKTVPAVMGTEDLTFTAQWEKNAYTVRFHSQDGSGTMADQGFLYDTEMALNPNTFTRPGYAFGGWTAHPGSAAEFADEEKILNLAITGVVDLYAVWTPVTYRIQYHLAGGVNSSLNPGSYNILSSISLEAPTRVGYTFRGWQTEEGKPVEAISAGTIGDLVLTATWSANTDTPFKVTHYLQNLDGSYSLADTQTLTGTTGSSVMPQTLQYTGFAAPQKQTAVVAADGTAVIRYNYTRNSYTLTFCYEDGKTENTRITALYGQSITLPVPTREGYGFGGWTLNGKAYTAQTMGAENLTLRAVWNANQYGYTVNYYLQNVSGSGYTLETSTHGTADMDAVVTAEAFGITGFTAPQAQSLIIRADSDRNVVNYYYTRNQYTLYFDANGGTGSEAARKVYFGAAITAPTLTRTGHSFAGWNKTVPATMPANDLTVTASWTVNRYLIRFFRENGIELSRQYLEYGQPVEDPGEVGRTGYTFKGWDQPIPKTMPAQNLDITAVWEVIDYTITYQLNGGVNHPDNPTTYTIESSFKFQAPTRTGYRFTRWELPSGSSMSGVHVNTFGNFTVSARWNPNTYQVMFHANNGTGATTTQSFTYDTAKALQKNTFRKTGYAFSGWATSANGEKVYDDLAQVKNLTAEHEKVIHLYAVWTPETYAVTYSGLGGATNHPDNPATYQMDGTIHLNAPVNAPQAMHFTGWYLDSALTNPAPETMTVTVAGGLTLYAKWDYNTYFINYYAFRKDTNVADGQQILDYGKGDFSQLLYNTEGNTRFKNPGYKVAGWSFTQGGKQVLNANGNHSELLQELYFSTGIPAEDHSNIDLFAVWELVPYTITFDTEYGMVMEQKPVRFDVEDQEVTLPVPAMLPGYQFDGWYDESGNKVTKIVVSKGTLEDKVIYAENLRDYHLTPKISLIPFTITYNWNGGVPVTGAPTSFTVEAGEISLPTPKYETYSDYQHFRYWRDQHGNTYTTSMPSNLAENITLTAQWNLATVYKSIDSTPATLNGRVILDWRNETNTDVASHTGRNVTSDQRSYVKTYGETILIGNTSQTFTNCRIVIGSDFDVTIRLVNFKFKSNDAAYAIGVSGSTKRSVTIHSTGICEVSSSAAGGTAIDVGARTLTFTGNGQMTVRGGNGTNGSNASPGYAGGNGTNGGIGIIAKNLTVNMPGGTLGIYGGNGGNGGKGGNGDTNQAGGNGGYGGNGGNAVCLTEIGNTLIDYSTAYLYGGNGGHGGRGGDGGMGISSTNDSTRTDGRRGGDGGRGGNAGYGLVCGTENTITSYSYLVIQTGEGGDGGRGGNGGKGGTNSWNFIACNGSSGGNGGDGGRGGDAYLAEGLKTTGSVSVITAGAGTGGGGGTGGAKGDTGCGAVNSPHAGSNGLPGANGATS